MPEQPVAISVAMIATRYELTPEAHRVVRVLADEHLHAWCVVAPIDEQELLLEADRQRAVRSEARHRPRSAERAATRPSTRAAASPLE